MQASKQLAMCLLASDHELSNVATSQRACKQAIFNLQLRNFDEHGSPLLLGALLPLCRRRHSVAPKPAQLPQCTESIAAWCVVALMPSQAQRGSEASTATPVYRIHCCLLRCCPYAVAGHNVAPKPAQLSECTESIAACCVVALLPSQSQRGSEASTANSSFSSKLQSCKQAILQLRNFDEQASVMYLLIYSKICAFIEKCFVRGNVFVKLYCSN